MWHSIRYGGTEGSQRLMQPGCSPQHVCGAAITCVVFLLVERWMIGRESRRMDAVLMGVARRSPAVGKVSL